MLFRIRAGQKVRSSGCDWVISNRLLKFSISTRKTAQVANYAKWYYLRFNKLWLVTLPLLAIYYRPKVEFQQPANYSVPKAPKCPPNPSRNTIIF
jgi:hypothetical protein